jgi:hypothetical protein
VKLRDVAKTLGLDVGCGDIRCVWGVPVGTRTNDECLCLAGDKGHYEIRMEASRIARVAQHLAAEVEHWQGIAKQRRERADAEIMRMQPVVEAAIAYCERRACENTLASAVDAYEKESVRG